MSVTPQAFQTHVSLSVFSILLIFVEPVVCIKLTFLDYTESCFMAQSDQHLKRLDFGAKSLNFTGITDQWICLQRLSNCM